LLEINSITAHYGKSVAIQDVSIKVEANSVVSLVGANGAGKSTVLKAMMGMVPLTSGSVFFKGQRIDGHATQSIVRGGIVLVPEGRQLFPYMSVLKNLKLGASLRKDSDGIQRDLDMVYQLFPKLRDRAKQKAGTLSGGEQQMLAIGRGLMANPQLLCLDEPSLGLAPVVIEQLGDVIKSINECGVSVLLVEQNIELAFGPATRCYALQVGRVVQSGTVEEMKSSEMIQKAYLGG
jgi:branched-chain amino acid transport system ATP-binding protein